MAGRVVPRNHVRATSGAVKVRSVGVGGQRPLRARHLPLANGSQRAVGPRGDCDRGRNYATTTATFPSFWPVSAYL